MESSSHLNGRPTLAGSYPDQDRFVETVASMRGADCAADRVSQWRFHR
jgi:hypothetical protein